ncbi:MAG: hypothetical protein ACYS9Y_11310 [Planctomycetota bacterium]|jgi:hypothetical protein
MIKIFRITSIIVAALTTVLVVASPVVLGSQNDKDIEEFLKLPGVVEEFKKAGGEKITQTDGQISPLVKQAKSFALYLNPPPKPKAKPKTTKKYKPKTAPKPAGPVTAQFKLIGTSFYESHPELSFALIDEPGKGFRWLRQSSSVGHLVIEEIKDGLVVIRDGQRTYDLIAERKPRKSLLRGKDAAPSTGSKPPEPDTEQTVNEEELLENIVKKMEAMAAPDSNDSQPTPDQSEETMQEVLSAIEAMRTHSEETKKLNDLGQELKNTQKDTTPVRRSRVRNRKTRGRTRDNSRTKSSPKIRTNAPDSNSQE